MIFEWSVGIYLALTHTVILNRCHHLLKEQISSISASIFKIVYDYHEKKHPYWMLALIYHQDDEVALLLLAQATCVREITRRLRKKTHSYAVGDSTEDEPRAHRKLTLRASGLESLRLESTHTDSKRRTREGSAFSMCSSASGSAGEVANELCRSTSCGVARVRRNVCARIDCDRDSSCERSSTKSCHDVQGVRTTAVDGLLVRAASLAPQTLPSPLSRRQRDPSGDKRTTWAAGVARTASLGCSS